MQSQIFLPNNHSKWQVNYRKVDRDVFVAVAAVFREYYASPKDTLINIEQVDEAEVNSNNFKLTYTNDYGEKQLLIRRFGEKRDKTSLDAVASVLEYLHAKNLRVPVILRSTRGNIFEKENDLVYIAFSFLPGDHFRGTLSELEDVAGEFARLNNVLSELPEKEKLTELVAMPKAATEMREYSLDVWERIFALAKESNSTRSDPAFDARLLSNERLIMDAVDNTPPELYKDTNRILVHFDLHPHNLLTDGKRLLAIIDFDSLREFEPMRAVAFALHRLVRQHVVHSAPNDIAAAVHDAKKVFLDAYTAQHPLTEVELDSIPYFVRSESLARLSNAMKDYYFNGNPAWKGDLDKQIMNIAESKFFV